MEVAHVCVRVCVCTCVFACEYMFACVCVYVHLSILPLMLQGFHVVLIVLRTSSKFLIPSLPHHLSSLPSTPASPLASHPSRLHPQEQS